MAPFLALLLLTPLTLLPATHAAETPFPGYPSPWGTGTDTNTNAADNSWATAYTKARAFVSQLTLTEKVNLTTGTGWEADRCIGMTGSIPRLGFKPFCLQDGPLGVRYTQNNSAFPAGINAAATFSRRLLRARGVAMGSEFRGKGIDIQLGPVAGALGRVPQGGRNWEGFGPDPYLTGVSMAETIDGIQSRGVIACAKHYILNEQEHYRGSVDVRIDDRTMHEVYLWPFADAVRAGVGSIMCSYNKVNGSYACENDWTTNYLLKNELGFQGFVMSDWGAQHTTLGSALAGLDMAMPGDGGRPPYNAWWGGALTEAVLSGQVPQWRLDDMATRIMAAFFKVHTGNYTERPEVNFSAWTNKTMGPLYPRANRTITVVNEFVDVQANHGALIREIGAKSVVILKNTGGALPLAKPSSIAVIGEDAHDNPTGPNACVERACIKGTVAMGYGSGTADFPYLVSPASALMRRAGADGTSFANISANWDLLKSQAVARGASVALVFATATAGENFVSIDGNIGDRNNLTLWDNGDALIAAVAAVNPNTVVILHTAGPVDLSAIKANPNVTAILWAGLPGQESGNGLVDVLYGDIAPQGRSPFTWGRNPREYGAELLFQAADPRNPTQSFDEGVFIDYRHFLQAGIEPVYAFGHGLSYTTFEYSNLVVTAVKPAMPYADATGMTSPAPTYGAIQPEVAAHTGPDGFERLTGYVYPWVVGNGSASVPTPAASTFPKEAFDGSAQKMLPAGGGAPGGNPGLWETVYTVTIDVTNTGNRRGTEIPQLYLALGGPNPPQVLRGFDEVDLLPGETKKVTFPLLRRDVSNWNTTSQRWEITRGDHKGDKFVFVGASVVNIRLNATLPALLS